MRKIYLTICTVLLSMGLAACGNRSNGTETLPSVTPTLVPETTESAVETESGAEDGTETQDTGAGQDDNLPIPGDVTWSDEMEKVKQAVVDTLGESYWPNAGISKELLSNMFGVSEELYDDYMGEMPMITINVDTMVIIKAKEDKVQDVEAALETYREAMVNNTNQYPMNLGKIQSSRIETFGNYVCFVQLGADVSAAADKGQEAVIEHCTQQNELALEVIGKAVAQ